MHAKESRNSLDPNPGQQHKPGETTKTGSDRTDRTGQGRQMKITAQVFPEQLD